MYVRRILQEGLNAVRSAKHLLLTHTPHCKVHTVHVIYMANFTGRRNESAGWHAPRRVHNLHRQDGGAKPGERGPSFRRTGRDIPTGETLRRPHAPYHRPEREPCTRWRGAEVLGESAEGVHGAGEGVQLRAVSSINTVVYMHKACSLN